MELNSIQKDTKSVQAFNRFTKSGQKKISAHDFLIGMSNDMIDRNAQRQMPKVKDWKKTKFKFMKQPDLK